jgi:hypothetical protein
MMVIAGANMAKNLSKETSILGAIAILPVVIINFVTSLLLIYGLNN